ncbi:MAG TPA: HAD family phosphatase [Streptosporangiaceae bacterium]|nr:HAD family phosphatase [Streptosporangiaceae bacterium]
MLRKPTEPTEPADPAKPTEPVRLAEHSPSDPASGDSARADHAVAPATPAAGELHGVLFDMDGLIVDSEPLWFEVECAVMARLGGHWGEADQQALIGGSLPRTVSYLLARAAHPASPEQVGRWLVEGMTSLLMSRTLTMLPGAAELLAEVRAAGIPYALVTSSERPIMDAVLRQLGVSFTATVCANDVTRGKPDPEPYLRAASLLGADPRHCVALEDSPNGVAAAEAAGCAMVAVPSLVPILARPGRIVAASLSQVDLALLRDLVAAR